MKMNDTVARIVDLMFDNTEMTEEVAALRDEVMNNCQERFFDLVESGVSEDDAISAVVESLKGMEDVVNQYQRKNRRAAQARPAAEYTAPNAEDAPQGEQHLVYAAGEIHQIDVKLVNEDVTLEASDDGDYHVTWDAEDHPNVSAIVQNGELCVTRRPGEWDSKNTPKHNVRVRVNGNKNDAHVFVNGQEVHFDEAGRMVDDAMGSVGSIMEKMGLTIGRMFSGIRSGFSTGFGVTIKVPACAIPHVRLLTTSGDVEVNSVALTDLNVTSTSGDVTVDLGAEERIEKAEFRTVSGDVDATLYADSVLINTTSGDMELAGSISTVSVNSVSGDVDVSADVAETHFRTVSGDVDLEYTSTNVREISGSTVSGDIDVDLPSGIGAIAVTTKTRSGDVTTRYSTNGFGPTVTGSLTSLSGDITIR